MEGRVGRVMERDREGREGNGRGRKKRGGRVKLRLFLIRKERCKFTDDNHIFNCTTIEL